MFFSKSAWIKSIVFIEVQIIEIGANFRVFQERGDFVLMERNPKRSILRVVFRGVDWL